MSAIEMALREIRHTIPPEILKRVFSTVYEPNHRGFYLSDVAIREAILDMVINDRVRPLCDATNPNEVEISLAGIAPQMVPPRCAIYNIPKSYTNGRRITSVLSIIYGSQNNNGSSMGYAQGGLNYSNGMSSMLSMANKVMAGMSPIAETENPYTSIIGENVICVENWMPRVNVGFLRCYVSNDENFTMLPEAYWPSFSQLCVKATKAFIYNFYTLEMNMGELVGGRELGKFREIIEEYRDAEDLFQEYYSTTFRKQVFLADARRKQRDVRRRIGSLGG